MEFLDDPEHPEMNFKPFLKLLTLTKPANTFGIFKFEQCLDNLIFLNFNCLSNHTLLLVTKNSATVRIKQQ